MISKTTIRKLEKQGYTMEEVQKCWENMKEIMTLQEFGKMMRIRANNP